VLSPELVRAHVGGDHGATERYRARTQSRLALGLGLCALAGACVASPILRAVLPGPYAAAAEPAALLCVVGALMMGVWSYHPLVTVTDNPWSLQLASMAGAVTNVALDFALAPRLGGRGVALANVAAWSLQLVVLSSILRVRIRARMSIVAPLLIASAVVCGLLLVGTPLAIRGALAAALVLTALTQIR
jgi:O-antigen/teichoic acid export membrane protein